ncbi:hypothetical protein D3C86_1670440 [compost metagenome]
MSVPVIHEASSLAAKATTRPTSAPSPTRPSGCVMPPTRSAMLREPRAMRSSEGDQVQAGDTDSTRMPRGASVTAKLRVIWISAALEAG